MSKMLSTLALAAALSTAIVVPAAQADPGRGHNYHGSRHAYHHGHHRGRGYWHNGKWVALGILGAAVGAAIAYSEYRDCYYRHGRRYCEY